MRVNDVTMCVCVCINICTHTHTHTHTHMHIYVCIHKKCYNIIQGWDEGERCRWGSPSASSWRASIVNGPAPTDRYGRAMLDKCATCLRPADLVALHSLLLQQQALILRNLKVHSESTQGVPQFLAGSLVAGNYSVRLDLTNWLHMKASTEHEVYYACV